MNSSLRWSSLVFFAGILVGTNAAAQTSPQVETPPPAEAPPPADTVSAPPPIDTVSAPPPMAPPPVAAPAPAAPAAQGPMRIETPNGSSIKFGLLLQPQYEALGDVNRSGYDQNLFIRRARILVGGSLFGVVDYFLDTDFPNLFRAPTVAGAAGVPNTATKASPGMNIQDAFVTYKPMGDMVKVDVGFMLPPMSHNAIQGAATLYGWDYYAFTFRHSDVFGSSAPSPVGRDMGAELRGLVLGGHLEYRAGIFQGLRNASATDQAGGNFFRVMARAQVNFLDAEPGFFYAGTYFGAKKIASIGGSYDFQDKYKYFSVDGILDMPVGPGVATAQVNFAQWDGGTFIAALPKQTAIQGEAGYNIAALHVSPIVRYEHLSSLTTAAGVNVTPINRYALGVAFWPYSHNTNLKAFYTRIAQNGTAHGANQINLQWQVYFF